MIEYILNRKQSTQNIRDSVFLQISRWIQLLIDQRKFTSPMSRPKSNHLKTAARSTTAAPPFNNPHEEHHRHDIHTSASRKGRVNHAFFSKSKSPRSWPNIRFKSSNPGDTYARHNYADLLKYFRLRMRFNHGHYSIQDFTTAWSRSNIACTISWITATKSPFPRCIINGTNYFTRYTSESPVSGNTP